MTGRRCERRARAEGRRHRRGDGIGQRRHARRRAAGPARLDLRRAPAGGGRGAPRARQHRADRRALPQQDRLRDADLARRRASRDFAFPFLPRHLTLVGAITIGIPSFFLALAPNTERFRPGFVERVLRFAIPTGTLAAIATFVAYTPGEERSGCDAGAGADHRGDGADVHRAAGAVDPRGAAHARATGAGVVDGGTVPAGPASCPRPATFFALVRAADARVAGGVRHRGAGVVVRAPVRAGRATRRAAAQTSRAASAAGRSATAAR